MIYDVLLERCPRSVNIAEMSYGEWLELRKSSIGGSDAGAIMRYVGEWGSPLTVFLNKKGLAVSKDMSPAAKRGKTLEPMVSAYFSERYPGLAVEKFPHMLYHPEYSFMSANLDGLVTGPETEINGKKISGLGGLEIKTTKTGYGFGKDEIPDGHYCQIQHYAAVTGLTWFVLAAYFLEEDDFHYYVIERNDNFITQDLIPAERDFWENYVLKDNWPSAVGIDSEEEMLTGMFEGGSSLALGEEEKSLCREYVEANTRIKEDQEIKDRVSAQLKEIIVQRQTGAKEKKISALAGPYSISWSRFERSDIDRDALKKDGLYEKYIKKSEAGRFTVTFKKGV
ncbi:MAG: YqaJ viral recombinase family protein [Treponema sp.]|nr:YqaJ viral recombinase family protein [Treponema sp.]